MARALLMTAFPSDCKEDQGAMKGLFHVLRCIERSLKGEAGARHVFYMKS